MKDAERLFEAIGEIAEDLIVEAEEAPVRRKAKAVRHLIAACLALCLIVVPVSAQMANGYVSNLLAPFYGSAQTWIVDDVGVPVGASVTVGDYTLTADAVIGDRYNIALVYSLVRRDGGELPEGLQFSQWERKYGMGGGGGSMRFDLSADRKTLYVVEQWTSTGGLFRFRRNVEVSYRDLVIWDSEQKTKTLVQEGDWTLKFTARYADATRKIPVKDLEVTGADGAVYTIQKLLLSPVGLHMKMLGTPMRDNDHMGRMYRGFTVQLFLKDGTCVEVEEGNLGGGGSSEDSQFKWRYGAMFAMPMALEEIRAIVICGTEVPVEIG